MMVICKCGKEFLTEADPYVIIPSSKGYETNCGCYFTAENESAKLMCAQLTTELEKLERIVEVLEKSNDFYADTKNWQYRGSEFRPEDCDESTGHAFFKGKTARQAKEEVERKEKTREIKGWVPSDSRLETHGETYFTQKMNSDDIKHFREATLLIKEPEKTVTLTESEFHQMARDFDDPEAVGACRFWYEKLFGDD